MVWNHPTICQVYILCKLNRNNFPINLNYYPLKPTTNTFTLLILVVAIDFDDISYLINVCIFRL